MVILAEELVVGVDQLTLAYGSGSLLAGHICRSTGQVQLANAHADGAGGDEDDLMACIFQIAEHLTQLLNALDVQPTRGVGQGGCTYFYGNSHGVKPLSHWVNRCNILYCVLLRKAITLWGQRGEDGSNF